MDWSYIACYIDTDGSISIPTKASKKDYSRVRLYFYSGYKPVLEEIKNFLNVAVTIYELDLKSMNDGYHRKVFYGLKISSRRKIVQILENSVPHMIIKREKTLDVLKHLNELLQKPSKRGRPVKPLVS